jgi:hypothetical protein
MSDFWEGFLTACIVLPVMCGVGLGVVIRLFAPPREREL